ncbi:MAG: hypothetical protein M0R74_03720 [Dehalococcoidia bacterium]|nr:hypothetical protein [Dehalococcoidia bacterium]
MSTQHELPERLQTALEGVEYDVADREVVRLVSVAALTRELAPAAPDRETTQRLREQFKVRMGTAVPPRWLRWLGAWAGSGPAPRPLVERLAAGVLLIGIAGGGAGTAAGASPLELASGAVRLIESAVTNLDPRGSAGGGQTPTESPTPTTTATPVPATPSPSPGATTTATATATEDHDDDDDDDHDKKDDDHSDDDSRGRSDNSGRGNSREEEPDDNPSDDEDRVR